jgi:hypothetical protein
MGSSNYVRYRISSQPAPNIVSHPNRFRVEVKRRRLAAMLLKELYHYRANLAVVTSRPCVYGTFSGPIGGFAARPAYCVGCLRCTVEHPDVVQIHPNPDRARLGDSYFIPDKVDTVLQEAATGQIPVRGAGYRGPFGGEGWDGMWTDMSEIVRPTRDGIHGREFISTAVDLGERPALLTFDAAGNPSGRLPRSLSLPIPFLFDVPPVAAESPALYRGLAEAAARLESLAIVPLHRVLDLGLHGPAIAPFATPTEMELLQHLPAPPQVVELDEWEESTFLTTRRRFPRTAVFVRVSLERDLMPLVRAGVRLFHVTADYHGRCGGRFVSDAIRAAHAALVKEGLREETVLIGSGGMITAADVPKAIICGLDAVALDTAVLVALQARFEGECVDRASAVIRMPDFESAWAAQRLMNLVASWRDQMLEILGAMGLREVRRLRGEQGRIMFQEELEREAFAGIAGFEG